MHYFFLPFSSLSATYLFSYLTLGVMGSLYSTLLIYIFFKHGNPPFKLLFIILMSFPSCFHRNTTSPQLPLISVLIKGHFPCSLSINTFPTSTAICHIPLDEKLMFLNVSPATLHPLFYSSYIKPNFLCTVTVCTFSNVTVAILLYKLILKYIAIIFALL